MLVPAIATGSAFVIDGQSGDVANDVSVTSPMTRVQRIAADDLIGVWRDSEHPDRIVVFGERETWWFNVGDIHYAGEPYTERMWFIEDGKLVKHERWISETGEPSPNALERRFAVKLRRDKLTLTDLDFDSVEVLRRERDPALVAELSRPLVRIQPTTRDEPRLGTLRWHTQLRSWDGETVFAGTTINLYLEGEDETDLRPFDRARAVIAHLEAGGLERCLAFAAQELLGLANDWRQDGDPVLDIASFRAQMAPRSIVIGSSTRRSLGVDVSEVFGDHGIDVHLDAEFQPVQAEMG